MNTSPTRRFSERAENYAKYRPGYPAALLTCLIAECRLTPASVVADIGSGTGILSRLFLEYGNSVFGVEPNDKMRVKAEESLAGYPNFTSIAARAEATTLSDHCVEFVTAGQAFHWFDPLQAKVEFKRILRPGGFAAFVWNEHDVESSLLMQAYEDLVVKYRQGHYPFNQQRGDMELKDFFAGQVEIRQFANKQVFEWDGFVGRWLSSSWVPLAGHPRYEAMLQDLRDLFDTHQVDSQVCLLYKTRLYFGRL